MGPRFLVGRKNLLASLKGEAEETRAAKRRTKLFQKHDETNQPENPERGQHEKF